MRKSNYVMRGIKHKTGISVGRITVYVGGCGHACAQVGVTIQVGVRPYSIGGVKQHWKQPPGVTACHPIPWVGGDNRIPEDQNLWGGAAWPSGFAASQGTPS